MTGVAWTLAVVTLTGSTLNMVTIALPPLIWVLGFRPSIHLLSRWQLLLAEGAMPGEACRRAVAELWRPCLYSAVTTALGFASLMVSSMRPVREMGAFAALGVLLCLASNFLFFPLLIAFQARLAWRRPVVREDHPVLEVFVGLSRHPGPSLGVSAILAVALAAGVPRLVAQANPIEFFRDSAPVATTYQQVLPEFTGPYSLEIILHRPRFAPRAPTCRTQTARPAASGDRRAARRGAGAFRRRPGTTSPSGSERHLSFARNRRRAHRRLAPDRTASRGSPGFPARRCPAHERVGPTDELDGTPESGRRHRRRDRNASSIPPGNLN